MICHINQPTDFLQVKAPATDTEHSPSSTINHLPGEVVLEIFDSYRQDVDPYNHQWRGKHVWVILAHVCRKWRAVVFASASRLDLGVISWVLKNQTISRRSCQVLCQFLSSSSARIKTLPVVPFGACVLRLDIMIGRARSPLTGREAISTNLQDDQLHFSRTGEPYFSL